MKLTIRFYHRFETYGLCITSYTEVIRASEHLLRGMKSLSKLLI
jgi:hypothetical protein